MTGPGGAGPEWPAPEPASRWRRAGAGLIDTVICLVGALVVSSVLLAAGGTARSESVLGAVRIALAQGALLLGPWIYLGVGWFRGATVGGSALGLRVVDEETGLLPSAGQCLRRAAMTLLSIAVAGAGIAWMAVDGRRRGWQDMAAGTAVVRVVTPASWVGAPPAPTRTPAAAAEMQAPYRAWTWTDVVPVLVLFYPLALGADYLVVKGVHIVHNGPITGSPRSVIGFLLEVLAYGMGLGLVAVLVRVRRHRPLRDLGLGRPDPRWLAAALPLGAFAIVASAMAGGVSQALFPGTNQTQCQEISSSLSSLAILTVLATSVVAPLSEEIVFRGFVLGWLQGRVPPAVAITLSAALFSGAHFLYLQPTLFLPIFVVGLALGLVYQLSRSVWPGVVMHGSLNLVATIVILVHPGC